MSLQLRRAGSAKTSKGGPICDEAPGYHSDLYGVLGVNSDSRPREIRAAYLQKAKEFHPDVSAEETVLAGKRFCEVNHAHAILQNVGTRRLYDLHVAREARKRQVQLDSTPRGGPLGVYDLHPITSSLSALLLVVSMVVSGCRTTSCCGCCDNGRNLVSHHLAETD